MIILCIHKNIYFSGYIASFKFCYNIELEINILILEIKMNKSKKLVVLAVVIVWVILFIYPKPFKQTYKDVQVYEKWE